MVLMDVRETVMETEIRQVLQDLRSKEIGEYFRCMDVYDILLDLQAKAKAVTTR